MDQDRPWEENKNTLRAEIKRLKRERDEARALNSINECGANKALDLMDDLQALCELHRARAEDAERKLAIAVEALRWIAQHNLEETNWRATAALAEVEKSDGK